MSSALPGLVSTVGLYLDRAAAGGESRPTEKGSTVGYQQDRVAANRVHLLRQTAPTEADCYVYQPLACLILQGAKEIALGDAPLTAGSGDLLVGSHEVPVTARVCRASSEEPYLAIIVPLDLAVIRGMHETIGRRSNPGRHALDVATVDEETLDALARYLKVAASAADTKVLEPLLWTELHYRLLNSTSGAMLHHLLNVDSHASRITEAIGMLRDSYRDQLVVADLAAAIGMSVSSFHVHFKEITGTSPLQYQKDLRLVEARRLLAAGDKNASEVSYAVGYRSASQFSREYARKFGVPPSEQFSTPLVEV